MKPKGRRIANITDEQREKLQGTLDKMETRREQENIRLKKLLKDKLEWVRKQISNGEIALRNLDTRKKDLEDKMLRLQGALIFAKELLEFTGEKKE